MVMFFDEVGLGLVLLMLTAAARSNELMFNMGVADKFLKKKGETLRLRYHIYA